MKTSPWTARLKEAGTPFRQVGGIAELDAVVSGGALKAAPAAFVIPLAEPAGRNTRTNAVHQQVGAAVGILIAVRNVSDTTGERSIEDLEAIRNFVRSKLLGWSPAAGYREAEFGGGAIVTVAGGHTWWQDDYASEYSIAAP